MLGPNGAGKTTMLQMLATLLPIDGGTRRASSASTCAGEPHAVRQLIGVTGQYASVDENLTGQREPRGSSAACRACRRAGRARTARRAARAVRPRGRRRQADRAVLRRHAPPARPRRQPDQPAAADLPRRADHRPRPAHPRADVGHHPRPRRRRLHRAAHDAVPRRGRPARRPDRGHRPRPQGRARARRTSSRPRSAARRCSCGWLDGPSRPRGPPTSSAGCSARSRCSRPRRAASTSPLTDANRAADVLIAPARGAALRSPRRPCRSRRSTRCSWPSPATAPRSRPARRPSSEAAR